MKQTSVQDSGSISLGSAKIEVGATLGSLVDVGVVDGVELSYEMNEVLIKAENHGRIPIKQYSNGSGKISFDLKENRLEILASLFSGLVDYSTVAGVLVSGATQAITGASYAFEQAIEIVGQNSDGSKQTISSVVASTDGSLVAGTDYYQIKLPNGKWGVAIHDSATVTTMSQTFTVTYSYTPSASKVLKYKDSGVVNSIVVRLTNTDDNSKTFVIVANNVKATAGLTRAFGKDEVEDANVIPVELTLYADTNGYLWEETSNQFA
jgi:hypothetical protein